MSSEHLDHLRIFPEELAATTEPDLTDARRTVESAFAEALGYSLAPTQPDEQHTSSEAELSWALGSPVNSEASHIDAAQAGQLLEVFNGLLSDLHLARRAVADREAELAAGVPLMLHRQEGASLSDRLQAILQAGAEALGADRAAMYVLNESTTELKLRGQWGFSTDKFRDAPRPLAGAIADLEALTGSAVALEDDLLNDMWRVPEPAAASICVPIASPTSILGTLWLYLPCAREISDIETNLAELTAGRVAAELEREMLWREARDVAPARRQSRELAELLHTPRQRPQPVCEQWRLAFDCVTDAMTGHSAAAVQHDWHTLPDDSLLLTLVDAGGTDMVAHMHAQWLAAALRSHAEHLVSPHKLLQAASRTLWELSSGAAQVDCALLRLDASGERFQYCQAGDMSALLIAAAVHHSPASRAPTSGAMWHRLTQAVPAAGEFEAVEYFEQTQAIKPGELLVLASRRLYRPHQPGGTLAGESTLARALAEFGSRDPSAAAAQLLHWAEPTTTHGTPPDACGVLVVGVDS